MNPDRKKVITVLFIAIILAISAGALLSHHINDDPPTINEKDNLSIAKSVARNWSDSSHLINIIVSPEIVSSGMLYSKETRYTFTNTSVGDIPVYCLEITIHTNGSYIFREYKWYSPNGEDNPLGNWSVTCTDAYEIAKNNEKIKAFMDAYPNSKIDGFMLSNVSGTPTWYIKMFDWGLWDDPHSAEIKIDATTGEVLYVEAAPGSSLSMQDICIGAFVVLIAVVAVAVLIARKKSRENEEKMRIEMEKRNMQNEIAKWDKRHLKK